jgi:hypothetical protein
MACIEPDQQSHMTSHETATPKPDLEVCEVHELAHQFAHWFYSMLNQHGVQCKGTQLGIEHFWQDCSMSLVFNSEKCCSRLGVKSSASEVVQLISDTRIQNGLYFNPNLSHEGVQGRTDVHGLVIVRACGTLHQQDRCVGIFEQLFGLIRDPSASNNWKIKFTELYLKSESTITSLPTLTKECLLRSISSVPDSLQLA